MSYSDYWRVNKSYVGHDELTNSLRALRKIVGYVGVDRETVWAGLSVPLKEETIELPLIVAQGTYPIPAEKMDVLVGLAAHEALHVRQDRQHAWGYLAQMFPRMDDKTELRRIAEAGEDIHVDGVAMKMGLLGKYVQKSRAWWRRGAMKDFTIGLPTAENLLGIWLDIVLDGIFPNLPPEKMDNVRESVTKMKSANETLSDDIGPLVEILCNGSREGMSHVYSILISMSRSYLGPLQMLLLETPEIIEGGPEDRALCYREFWMKLEPTFAEWKSAIAKLSEEERAAEQQACADSDVDSSLPPEVSDVVRANMVAEARDVARSVTARIESILMKLGGESQRHLVFETAVEDATELCNTAPHRKLVQRLKEVFRCQREESARTSRGLMSGKLDSKRLYRAYTTGMAFKRREYFPEESEWNIMLLLDASGSVAWCWEFFESIYAALVEALVEGNAKLDVFAYRENNMVCELTRVFRERSLYTLFPSGATPTGEAVIAAGLMLPQAGKKLMIHITDGLWNTGVDTWYALEFCRRQQIDLVTLGYGSAHDALELQYGNDFHLMDSIEALPKALEALLRKKLLGL